MRTVSAYIKPSLDYPTFTDVEGVAITNVFTLFRGEIFELQVTVLDTDNTVLDVSGYDGFQFAGKYPYPTVDYLSFSSTDIDTSSFTDLVNGKIGFIINLNTASLTNLFANTIYYTGTNSHPLIIELIALDEFDVEQLILAQGNCTIRRDVIVGGENAPVVTASIKHNRTALTEPTVDDDYSLNYDHGSIWIYNDLMWVCTDNTIGAAVWALLTGYAEEVHTHVIADITDMPADLSDFTDTTGLLDAETASEIAVVATPVNYTAATPDVEAHLAGIDSELATVSGAIPTDVSDLTDTTGIIPLDLSDITDTTGLIPADLSDITDTTGLIPADLSDLTDTTNLIPADLSDLTDTTNLIPADLSDLTDTTSLLDKSWLRIATASYAATPASTSRLTMSATAGINVGNAIRYTDGRGTYFAHVIAISSNAYIDIAGAALATDSDLTALYVSKLNTSQMVYQPEVSLYAVSTGNVGHGQKWLLGNAKLVRFSAWHETDDATSQPKVNIAIGANLVSTEDTNAGITIAAAETETFSSAVAIDTSKYSIAYGDIIYAYVTTAGGTGDAEFLHIDLIFILE